MNVPCGLEFVALVEFLQRVPAVQRPIGTGLADDRRWWVKFAIDIDHTLAWRTVQEFGHVLNYLALNERLPTVFIPVSPPPYLNGGPRNFLTWVIQSTSPEFTPAQAREWLEGRLPRPVEDAALWTVDEELD